MTGAVEQSVVIDSMARIASLYGIVCNPKYSGTPIAILTSL